MYKLDETLCDNYNFCRILRSGSPQIVNNAKEATHYIANGNLFDIATTTIEEIETTTYTAEQLAEMTTAELKAICTELGISTHMDAENMITLIMDKQKGENI